MRILLVFLLLLLSFPAFSLSPWSKYESFLVYEKKKKAFEEESSQILKNRLKELSLSRKKKTSDSKAKALQAYERKKEQRELKRKKAFSVYKRKYANYQKRQSAILESRLKVLKQIRSEQKLLKTKTNFVEKYILN